MCLFDAQTENLPQSNIAWKLMKYSSIKSKWITPVFNSLTYKNKLKAYGEPVFNEGYRNSKKYTPVNILEGGAIHCYRTRTQACITRYSGLHIEECRVFEVKGTDCVAYSEKEIAFKEIEFVDDLSDESLIPCES